jgi:hypothetical protein
MATISAFHKKTTDSICGLRDLRRDYYKPVAIITFIAESFDFSAQASTQLDKLSLAADSNSFTDNIVGSSHRHQ